MTNTDETDALAEAIEILYSGPPDRFMEQRSILSKAVRAGGDPSTAKAITALRRPTVAAAVVNRFVRDERDAIEQLLFVGARLRAAHEALDAARLRELSTERRTLVAELSRSALERFGPESPSATLRDDVSNSFDAAVADPEIAGRLGTLIRPERWSGFGGASADGPGLTLVHGGRVAKKPAKPASGATVTATASATSARTSDTASASERRRSNRLLTKARNTFDSAENALLAAQEAEQTGLAAVHQLSDQLADLSHQIDEAKRQLDSARRAVKSARARRREARSALDRAERHAPTS